LLDGVLPLVLAGCLTRWVASVLVQILPAVLSRWLRAGALFEY
jgi:hypothetical protein